MLIAMYVLKKTEKEIYLVNVGLGYIISFMHLMCLVILQKIS